MDTNDETEVVVAELPTKITIRLSPYEARALWRLRTAGLPVGARPRTVTQVLVHALLEAAARLPTARS